MSEQTSDTAAGSGSDRRLWDRARAVFQALWTWAVAAAILVVLLRRVPADLLRESFQGAPVLLLALYAPVHVLITLLADGAATRQALTITGFELPLRRLLLVRGATYLLGVVNYALGQGGVGFYLQRAGMKAGRAAGTVLFIMITNFLALLLTGTLGLAAVRRGMAIDELRWWLAAAYGGLAVYLGFLAIRFRGLQRQEPLKPLFTAGLRGHAKAIAVRLPHVLLLVIGHWGAMRIWGVAVPFSYGLALMPIIMLVAALPIVPAGIGAIQAVQVALFQHYSLAPTPAAQSAEILAFSLGYHALGLISQFVLGFFCLMLLRTATRPAAAH